MPLENIVAMFVLVHLVSLETVQVELHAVFDMVVVIWIFVTFFKFDHRIKQKLPYIKLNLSMGKFIGIIMDGWF